MYHDLLALPGSGRSFWPSTKTLQRRPQESMSLRGHLHCANYLRKPGALLYSCPRNNASD